MGHSFFIAGAYAATALIIGGLIVRAILESRSQTRALAELEARGVGRRSAKSTHSTGKAVA